MSGGLAGKLGARDVVAPDQLCRAVGGATSGARVTAGFAAKPAPQMTSPSEAGRTGSDGPILGADIGLDLALFGRKSSAKCLPLSIRMLPHTTHFAETATKNIQNGIKTNVVR